ncbi:MAG: CBS domain-containing protein [Planctomycetes bacterium]|nr:CBS domain-containing protein [Planctomycetota bacterium]
MSARPVLVDASASLDEAMRLMDDHDVRHLPVLRDGSLVGVVSDRDVMSATGWLPANLREPSGPSTVGDLVRKKAVTATPDDSIVMTAVDMVSREIGCLPVLEDGAVVGIVTEMDMLSAYIDVSEQDNESLALHAPVSELMSANVLTVAPNTSLWAAMDLAKERHVRHLPVVEDGRVVGIVSDRDLRRAAARHSEPGVPVNELMSHDPLTLDPEEPLSRAAACMYEARIGGLPVVDDGRLVGILTLTDLLDYCIANLRHPDKR